MAKINSLMYRGAKGQIGGQVLYTRNGETVARELAPQVTNPRTPAQMEQRVKLSNLVAVYRANMAWMKGAFENKKPKESDYNAFVSANIANTEVALSKSNVASGAAVVAPYKISNGTLPMVETLLNGTDLVSNIALGNLAITDETTIGELSQAILANNAGIVAGMQLSVIINMQLAAAGSGVPYINTRAYELIINEDDTTPVLNAVPDGILESVGTTSTTLGINTSDLGDGAGAFVLSRTIGGKTYVSTQALVFYGSNATYRAFTSPQAVAAAISSYGEGAETFLSSISANGANSVAATLALLGIMVGSTEYVAGARLRAALAENAAVSFLFNKAIKADAVVSGYYTIGTSATKYNLTNVALSENRRSINAVVGTTTLPSNGQAFRMIAVIDGDEFPISLSNYDAGSGGGGNDEN